MQRLWLREDPARWLRTSFDYCCSCLGYYGRPVGQSAVRKLGTAMMLLMRARKWAYQKKKGVSEGRPLVFTAWVFIPLALALSLSHFPSLSAFKSSRTVVIVVSSRTELDDDVDDVIVVVVLGARRS